MRLSFTGTRTGMTDFQKTAFRVLLRQMQPSVFIHGCCVGADDDADLIASEEGILRIGIPSDHPDSALPRVRFAERTGSQFVWAPTGPEGKPKKPLDRNFDIVKCGDAIWGCPRTGKEEIRSGTWHAIRIARAAKTKRPVTIIWPDGMVQEL